MISLFTLNKYVVNGKEHKQYFDYMFSKSMKYFIEIIKYFIFSMKHFIEVINLFI